jgi:hypothetical protein
MEELINEDSESPYISFWAILVVDEAFRAHVDWASNVEILKFFLGLYGKSEISDFGSSI